jgi:CDGSH-type Zn-finger protein
MPEPKIAGTKPHFQDMEPGTYYWCACGESKGQPFCDGSHQGTGFTPVEFTIDKPRKAALCLCKRTANPPFCDGTHQKLEDG